MGFGKSSIRRRIGKIKKNGRKNLVRDEQKQQKQKHSVDSSPSTLISKEQDDEIKCKSINTASMDQCKSMKNQRNSQGDDQMVSSGSPGSPTFDPSRYTHKELIDAMEESKKVCIEMERRETARLNEIASRLFESDDDDESSIGKSIYRKIYW